MCLLSEIGRSEAQNNEEIRKRLRRILKGEVHEEPNPDRTNPDGVIVLQIGDVRIMILLMEFKRELGEGGSDPSHQAGLSMKHSWLEKSVSRIYTRRHLLFLIVFQRREICEKSCCPTLLLAGGGPWLAVLGGVFTDKIIVQRLTDMRWMGMSSTEEDSRVYYNARVFVALRQCLNDIPDFYRGLRNTPQLQPNEPHPRYFPYPTSFTDENGRVVRFRYLRSLEDDAACVTYLAEVIDDTCAAATRPRLVVKFVARYGKEVHQFLADEGHAPALRYYGPLPGTKTSGVLPGPAQNAPPGLSLRLDVMHMVIMDHIDSQPHPPTTAREQIEAMLTKLHCNGYVFGDLRHQNILFADDRVILIDFNWCGQYDMRIREDGLPEGLQQRIDKSVDRTQPKDEDRIYVRYPLSMSTAVGTWAAGMRALELIRPQHDWMMAEKLIW